MVVDPSLMHKRATVDLNIYEIDYVLGLLSDKVTVHSKEAKMAFLVDEITEAELKWHVSHSEFINNIRDKIQKGFQNVEWQEIKVPKARKVKARKAKPRKVHR